MLDLSAGDWILIATSIVTIASVIVRLTPSETDDELVAQARRFLERVALNAEPTQPTTKGPQA